MKTPVFVAAWVFLTAPAFVATCSELRLPEPPQQRRAWHPDANIPINILSAVSKIYEQGFPDPRGCEYREIEVEVCGGVWGGTNPPVKTRGWLLPKKSGTNQFAICWNGLIYPVVTISGPADVHAEFTNAASPGRFGFRGGGSSAAGEAQTVLFRGAQSTRVLLLLRLDETTLALTNWSPNQRMFGGGRPVQGNDPYLEFAGDWAWAMFDRTICAHMRGDESLALATARQLTEVQPKIEEECARRGFQGQQDYDSRRQGKERPYLDFLEQLPQLLADLERRASEPKKINIVEAGITNFPDQTKRVAILIDDLDLVAARQWSQPGWVYLPEDLIVLALIQEGDAAVEPLLDCMDNDKRLTRAVGFFRDFARNRTVIPVHDAARATLLSILQAGFGDGTPEIRTYWNQYKNLKLEDRWYAILNDDSARARWGEAASHIIQPDNVTTYPRGYRTARPVPTNAPARLRGEILRAKTNPSVTELLVRHALEVPTNDVGSYDLSTCCQFAVYLARWDPQAALPVAKTLSKRVSTVTKYSGQQLGNYITQLSLVRADAGDPQAFHDYAEWIITTTPEQLEFFRPDCLEPLRKFPTNQVLQSAAEKIFAQTNSAWSRLPWKDNRGGGTVDSGLVALSAYRVLLTRELRRTNFCGNISWVGNSNYLNYNLTNLQSGGFQIEIPNELQPTNGAVAEIRWCDWIAMALSNGKHIPFFNPFAPVEKRDEVIAKAEELLKQP